MNKNTTCNDCYYHCTCPERRGICVSFIRKRDKQSHIKYTGGDVYAKTNRSAGRNW